MEPNTPATPVDPRTQSRLVEPKIETKFSLFVGGKSYDLPDAKPALMAVALASFPDGTQVSFSEYQTLDLEDQTLAIHAMVIKNFAGLRKLMPPEVPF